MIVAAGTQLPKGFFVARGRFEYPGVLVPIACSLAVTGPGCCRSTELWAGALRVSYVCADLLQPWHPPRPSYDGAKGCCGVALRKRSDLLQDGNAPKNGLQPGIASRRTAMARDGFDHSCHPRT